MIIDEAIKSICALNTGTLGSSNLPLHSAKALCVLVFGIHERTGETDPRAR